MKHILGILLALCLVVTGALTMSGCTSLTDTTVNEASTSDVGTDEGGAATPEELTRICDYSMLGLRANGHIVYEHYLDSTGKPVRTDGRHLEWAGGMVLEQYRYTYEDGTISRVERYGINEDREDIYTFTPTLIGFIEFSRESEDVLVGTVYDVDNYGLPAEKGETCTITYKDGGIVNVQCHGTSADYGEDGRKLSETDGDTHLEFTYDGNNVTEIKEYREDVTLQHCTAEYGENGFIKAFSSNIYEDDGSLSATYANSYEINDGGQLLSFEQTHKYVDDDSESYEEYNIEYTDAGNIKSATSADNGDTYTTTVSYDENGRVSVVIGERYRDGEFERRSEECFVYNSDGKKAEKITKTTEMRNSDSDEAYEDSTYTTYTYDENGRLTEIKTVREKGTHLTAYEYGADGRPSRIENFQKTEDFSSRTIEEYEYHANGKKKQRIWVEYGEDGVTATSKWVSEYDEFGDEVKHTVISYENGSEVIDSVSTSTHTREYRYGMVVKCVTETIKYDAQNNPQTKSIYVSKYSGNGAATGNHAEEYTYIDGEWVKNDGWM